jgi:hypothetical protein
MNEFDETITEIDDGDKIQAKLKSIGSRHKKHGLGSSNIFLVRKKKCIFYFLKDLLLFQGNERSIFTCN